MKNCKRQQKDSQSHEVETSNKALNYGTEDVVRCNRETFNNYNEFLNWSELETETFKTCQDEIGSVVRRRNDT